jgi:hypothetical protein
MDGFRMVTYTDNKLDVIDFLSELSNSDTSNQEQNAIMEILLRRLDFNKAIVIYGIVYLEGKGTRSAPPTSINAIAKMILKMVKA